MAEQIRTVAHECASDGYRRVTALVNRSFGTDYNRQRIRRVMNLTASALQESALRRPLLHQGSGPVSAADRRRLQAMRTRP